MSLGSDYRADHCVDIEDIKYHARLYAKNGIWVKKDGTRIKISDMSDNHIANSINLLKRNESVISDIYIPVLKAELDRRR